MKKAKRLLAVLMAIVMLFSAACVNVYAFNSTNYYLEPKTSDSKYYLTYDQAAGWLLDMLDEMLADANITLTCDELNDMVGVGINLFTSNILLNLDDKLEDAGNPKGLLDLRNVDGLIRTLEGLFDALDGTTASLADALGLLGGLIDETDGLNRSGLDYTKQRQYLTVSDREVLEMLINWISNQRNLFRGLLAGTLDFGSLLGGVVEDLIVDLVGYTGTEPLKNMDYVLQTLLYQMLIDDSVTEVSGTMLDDGVQQVIDWALIDGTGITPAEGGNSLLGANFEPLIGEALRDQPGGASITGIAIESDQDLDGVPEAHTMSTYQFVANLIRGLLDSVIGPMLTEMLCDLFDVEITEQYPNGDPEIMSDQMFSMIIGLVESLLVQNGAPEPVYTDEENTYPLLKIQAMVDWLFNEGGLDTFILIDYQGIHLQDNLMSLLNDLIRLLVNMLPSLGLFQDSAYLGYESDELTAIWYYADTSPKTLVAEDDETAVDQTYITYETGDILYATTYEEIDGVTVATAYNYVATDMPVNISDSTASDYANPDFIRPNYVVETDKVYATVIKMALNDMIEGCYFPEWADDIPSVLAYAMAGLAAQPLPENNFYERLDAYHELELAGGVGTVTDGTNQEIDPIPYSTIKRITHKDIAGTVTGTEDVVVPSGALDIGCSYLAAYFNNILLTTNSMEFSTDTTFEKFLTQFITWALQMYMPVLVGVDTNGNGVYGETGEHPGIWTTLFNNLISTVYEDVGTLTFYADVETYTSSGVLKIDAIYDFLDATLFSLIPTSWLPDINGSSQMINSWLLGNLIEFDLIGILDLLTVNMDYVNGELNQPLLTVLIRVIDRVLALVFNGESVLIPTRNNVLSGGGNTTVTTLSQLLSSRVDGSISNDASLPQFIYRLLEHLGEYKYELLSTALPLLAGMDYVRSFKTDNMLESTMKVYGVEKLEEFTSSLTDNINASILLEGLTDKDMAEDIVNGRYSVKRNAEGTAYDLILTTNETIYGSYATKPEADAVVESFKNTYIEEVLVTEATEEAEAVYTYNIWREWSYLETATRTDTTDDKGALSKFTGFKFSNLTSRTTAVPFVSYEQDQFQYFRYEDFGAEGHRYAAVNTAVDAANEYADSYRSFSENDLSNAYHDWVMYSVYSQLYNKSIYDKNDDGVFTLTDITDSTDTTIILNYADGTPSIPKSMYPFRTTTSTSYAYLDYTYGANASGPIQYLNTIDMADMNESNYEQLALALEMGADEKYDVQFSREEVEAIVRLAIGSMKFDITPTGRDEAGNLTYNAGSVQWDGLTGDENNLIVAWLNERGFTYKAIENSEYGAVDYAIFRPRFQYIDTSNILITGASSIPMTRDAYNTAYGSKTMTQMDAIAHTEEINIQIYKSYCDYIKTLYDNREALYDYMDTVSYRYEQAEAQRSKTIDITMLEWATNNFKSAYEGNAGRNLKYDGVDANGALKTTKLYTATSYEKFRIAYDYALSLIEAKGNALMADDELTQTMCSVAFYGIIETYYALVPYLSDADWTQLQAYIDLAKAIIDDPISYDAYVGYNTDPEGQWGIMESVLSDAESMKANEQLYDGERQSEIDDMAAALYQAIYKLEYLTVPDLISTKDTAGEELVGVVATNQGTSGSTSRITGQVFGLEEGVGAIMDLVQAVGMREDAGTGTVVTIQGSGRGLGTGAYYLGTVENRERFRYYAVVYGDLNGDARVDGTDASILEIAAMTSSDGTITQTEVGSAAKFEAADANHDGSVDDLDVAKIVSHYTFSSEINQKKHSTTIS